MVPCFGQRRDNRSHGQKLVSLLRGVLSAVGIDPAGYSFQIGTAMTPAAVRIGAATIQTLGIWASDGYVRYTRMPRQSLE